MKVGKNIFVDPVIDEEASIDARLAIATLEDGTICALQKGGEQPLSKQDIEEMLKIASEKGKDLRGILSKAVGK